MTLGPVHRRLPEWEPYDKITVELEPRLKTSGMSGDEWQTGAKTTLWFKGRPIVESFCNALDFALANIAALVAQHSCPFDDHVLAIEEHSCDQPSCTERPVSRYRIKQLFSDRGEKLDPSESGSAEYHYRQFCARHLYRGDCSREDCDRNYIVVSGPGPLHAEDRASDESPAMQIVVNAMDSDRD